MGRLSTVGLLASTLVLAGGFALPAQAVQVDPPWNLDRIDQRSHDLDAAYNGPTGAFVTAYLIDTGITLGHNDFGGRANYGANTTVPDSDPAHALADDCYGHGTPVAGIVGGTRYGVNKTVRLVAVKAYDCQGVSTEDSIQRAVAWVNNHATRPAVANLSISVTCKVGDEAAACPAGRASAIRAEIARGIGLGIPYVIGAGDNNIDACGNPFSREAGAIRVAASTATDARRPASAWGSCVDLFAPGDGIETDNRSGPNTIATLSGGGAAAAHVTGALALMLGRPGWGQTSPAALKAALLAEATPDVLTGLVAGTPNRLLYVPPPFGPGSSVAAMQGPDGRLTLYTVDRGERLRAQRQNQPNVTGWPEPTLANGSNSSAVCAQQAPSDRGRLAVAQPNQRPWFRDVLTFDPITYTSWRSLEGQLAGCALARNQQGRAELFGIDHQGRLLHWSRTDDDKGYKPREVVLGGPFFTAVAAERTAASRVELFLQDETGVTWHTLETGLNSGAYAPPARLPGGGVYHALAVAANANRSLVLFQVDLMGRVWQRTSQPDDSWSPATLVSRPEVGEARSVAAESNDDGRIELFVVNTKGELWDFSQDATDGSTFRPPVRIGDNVRS